MTVMTDINIIIDVDCWNVSIKEEYERLYHDKPKPVSEEGRQHLIKKIARHMIKCPECAHIMGAYYV